jgi:hypothetical protein
MIFVLMLLFLTIQNRINSEKSINNKGFSNEYPIGIAAYLRFPKKYVIPHAKRQSFPHKKSIGVEINANPPHITTTIPRSTTTDESGIIIKFARGETIETSSK